MGKTSYKIALATQGTRGDFQPMLSLALGFRRAGHNVLLMGNADHIKAAHEFGFEGVVCCTEIKDLLKTEHGKKAMETGDLVSAAKAFEDDTEDWPAKFRVGLDKFEPDLLLYSALIGGLCEWYVNFVKPDLAAISTAYQPQVIPSSDFGPVTLQRVELEEGCPLMAKWVMNLQGSAQQQFNLIQAAKENGASQSEVDSIVGPEYMFMRLFQMEEAFQPLLLGYSEAFWPAPKDWPKSGYHITGRWNIPREEQEERVKSGVSFFSVGSEQQQCADFISAGEPPVYIGWGSMTVNSDEHMTILAVSALRIAGRRGIIVAGWADCSSESLASAPDVDELIEFCEKNVLFMKAAPHEWLFPQCACCVHHGGVGTAQASLGAGSPTIVTPVFADQYDIAEHITKRGWGLGTCRLPKLTAEELGEAIREVAGDRAMKARVVDLAERMAKEDGVGRTVTLAEQFMSEQVMTGEWKKAKQAFNDKALAWRKRNEKLRFEQICGQFTVELNKTYPDLKAWNEKAMDQFNKLAMAAKAGKLLYVKGSSSLARAGEKLKSDEVGRFKEFAFLELLEKKGSRLRVQRLKGVGPESGWVSAEVKGVEIVAPCGIMDIGRLQAEEFTKMFADVLPTADSKVANG